MEYADDRNAKLLFSDNLMEILYPESKGVGCIDE
jgi:hypothetical protein